VARQWRIVWKWISISLGFPSLRAILFLTVLNQVSKLLGLFGKILSFFLGSLLKIAISLSERRNMRGLLFFSALTLSVFCSKSKSIQRILCARKTSGFLVLSRKLFMQWFLMLVYVKTGCASFSHLLRFILWFMCSA